jgi:glyoxylase-like metal-dependent hydrolase (beta-lactamase superfamily II)
MTGAGNNTYLIIGSEGRAALIDAGVGEARHLDDIARQLKQHAARLDRVLVTHSHADHASGAPALAAAHEGAHFQKYPWRPADVKIQVKWEPLADGDRIDIGRERLIALHTPGHSPDHVVFWHQASRTVFTGDLIVPGSSVMIHWSGGGDLAQYMASLERVLALHPQRLLPAHGAEAMSPATVVREHLDHRRMREAQIVQALTLGLDTVEAIGDYIYHGLSPALIPAARENVRAHLEKLRSEGRVVEHEAKWTWIKSSTSSM